MTTVVTNGTAPRSDLAECARGLAERFMVSGVAIGQVQEPAQTTSTRETSREYALRKARELAELLDGFRYYKPEDKARLTDGLMQTAELITAEHFSGEDGGANRQLTNLVNEAKRLRAEASEEHRQRQLARALALYPQIERMEPAAALDLVSVLVSLGCNLGSTMFKWLSADEVKQALEAKLNVGLCTHKLNLLEQYLLAQTRPAQNGHSPTPARRHILRKQEKSRDDKALRARMKGPQGQHPPKGRS